MRSCAKPLNTSGKRGRNNPRNKVVRRARATPAQEQQLRAAIKWTASSPSFATACVQVVSRKHTSSAGVQERFPGGIVQKSSRSEEHTSELQSRLHLVCRLLLEKKKKKSYRDD